MRTSAKAEIVGLMALIGNEEETSSRDSLIGNSNLETVMEHHDQDVPGQPPPEGFGRPCVECVYFYSGATCWNPDCVEGPVSPGTFSSVYGWEQKPRPIPSCAEARSTTGECGPLGSKFVWKRTQRDAIRQAQWGHQVSQLWSNIWNRQLEKWL